MSSGGRTTLINAPTLLASFLSPTLTALESKNVRPGNLCRTKYLQGREVMHEACIKYLLEEKLSCIVAAQNSH